MNISPSKRMVIGTTTLISGVLLQLVIALRTSEMDASAIASVGDAGEPADHLLEQAHFQMVATFAGWTMSWTLIAAGVMIVTWGMYRHFLKKVPPDDFDSPSHG
jgi:hypothetical protein